jgi:hypothetical protein
MHEVGRSVVTLFLDKHPSVRPFVVALDTARVGADLMRQWELPERMCKAIEVQERAQFTSPEVIPEDCRKEVAVLHLAHVFEATLRGTPVSESHKAYFGDYCDILKITPARAWELYNTRVLPNIAKNKHRFPPDVRSLLVTEGDAA